MRIVLITVLALSVFGDAGASTLSGAREPKQSRASRKQARQSQQLALELQAKATVTAFVHCSYSRADVLAQGTALPSDIADAGRFGR